MKSVILWLLKGCIAWLSLGILCLLILLPLYGCWLRNYLKKFGQWASFPLSLSELRISFHRAQAGGKAWWPKRHHFAVAVVGVTIAGWGFLRSAASGDASDFSRSGSLITLLGLLSAVVGLAHAQGLTKARSIVDKNKAAQEKGDNAERADRLTRCFIAFVIILGTLIWGYGDLAFEGINRLFCPVDTSWVQLRCSTKNNPQPALPPSPQRFLVLFDWNSTALQTAAEEIIIEATLNARKDTNPLVCLVGHTDASGSPKYNLGLSECRANAVKVEMLKLGLNSAEVKLSFKGAGDLLVPSAKSREMLNRNVEILIDHGSASNHCR